MADLPEFGTHIMSLDEATGRPLSVGDVVAPLNGNNDLNRLEIIAAQTIDPYVDMTRVTFAKSHLSDELRPRDFHGSLLNGIAVVVPPDLERFDTRRDSRRIRPLTEHEVLSLSVTVQLQSAVGSGEVVRDVTYFSAANHRGGHNEYGTVGRAMGPSSSLQAASELARTWREESSTSARVFAAWALEHTYQAGAPESERRGH